MDPFAVEVGNRDVATVVFAIGDALGDALVRPGRVVVHLVFGQDGAQMALPEDQQAVPGYSAPKSQQLAATINCSNYNRSPSDRAQSRNVAPSQGRNASWSRRRSTTLAACASCNEEARIPLQRSSSVPVTMTPRSRP